VCAFQFVTSAKARYSDTVAQRDSCLKQSIAIVRWWPVAGLGSGEQPV
jgi:hypothetical protein